jgi:hypothetical protein
VPAIRYSKRGEKLVRSFPPFAIKWVKAVRVNKPKMGGDRRWHERTASKTNRKYEKDQQNHHRPCNSHSLGHGPRPVGTQAS